MKHLCALITLLCASLLTNAQSTSGIRGKVRSEDGKPLPQVSIVISQKGIETAQVETNNKGEFAVDGLEAGLYDLTFRKSGYSVSTLHRVDVLKGKAKVLHDNLYLPIDEGSLAILRVSVLDTEAKSIPNARIEIERIEKNNQGKKLDIRAHNENGLREGGLYTYHLPPQKARYRIKVEAQQMKTQVKELEVDGAERYSVVFSLSSEGRDLTKASSGHE